MSRVIRNGLAALLLGAVAVASAACAPEAEDDASSTRQAGSADGTPITLVTDAKALATLEAAGYDFSTRFAGDVQAKTGKQLATNAAFKSLSDFIKGDLAALRSEYKARRDAAPAAEQARWMDPVGEGGGNSAVQRAYPAQGRIFSEAWLASSALRFELVAVSNRLDRRHVPDRAATCGERRLIYRAAHDGPRGYARLPFTLVLAYSQGTDCQAVAKNWFSETPLEGTAMAGFLANGPMANLGKPFAIELNIQTEVWSRFFADRSDEGVGRHHRYSLRVFTPTFEGDRIVALSAAKLENTPDVEKILATPDMRDRLVKWLKASGTVQAIEKGTAILPKELLAENVFAATGMGATRMANRPFSRIFEGREGDLAQIPGLAGTTFERTPEALLRRLDTMTCNGCHVTRSISGLHLPGEERNDAQIADAVAVGVSPHLRDEMDRRADDLRAFVQSGGAVPMPPIDKGHHFGGVLGAPCAVPGKTDSGLSYLTCKGGLLCLDVDGGGLGTCSQAEQGAIGDRCETHAYSSNPANMLLDTAPITATGLCAGGADVQCGGREEGVPVGGMCIGNPKLLPPAQANVNYLDTLIKSGTCDNGRVKVGADVKPASGVLPGTVCGIFTHETFVDCWGKMRLDQCLGRVSQDAGTTKLRTSTMAIELRACDPDHPCRDEFYCARVPSRAKDHGVCAPSYIAYQFDVDAHVLGQ